MSHTIRDKKKLQARASKIEGQVSALKKMLDEPHECAAVLQQIAAIRGAVNGLMREVIKGHLTEHIVHEGDEVKREEDLDVVLKLLNSNIKERPRIPPAATDAPPASALAVFVFHLKTR